MSTENDKNEQPNSEYQGLVSLQHKLSKRIEVRELGAAGRVPVRIPMYGYAFPWGQIAERLSGMRLVFDFYLEEVDKRFTQRTTALQERVFALLEELTDHTARDNALGWEKLAADFYGWKIIPGTIGKNGAFTILCHLEAEQDCRNWLIGEFLPEILPQVLERAGDEI